MKLNPYLNAILAGLYIWGLALLFQFVIGTHADEPDTWIAPILALSILVFSVALMGFLFFYNPLVLLIENKRNEAVSYFLKTIGTFGLILILTLITFSLI